MQLERRWRSSAVTQRRAFQLNPASLCAHKDTRHVREEVILKVCPALATPVDCHADCAGVQTVQLSFFPNALPNKPCVKYNAVLGILHLNLSVKGENLCSLWRCKAKFSFLENLSLKNAQTGSSQTQRGTCYYYFANWTEYKILISLPVD